MVIIGTTIDPDTHFILIKKYPIHAVITHVGCKKKRCGQVFYGKIINLAEKQRTSCPIRLHSIICCVKFFRTVFSH